MRMLRSKPATTTEMFSGFNRYRGSFMEIGKDTFVILEYSVRLEDGVYVKGEHGPVSLNFIVGYNQLLPSLEKRLLGMSPGSETDFAIPAREAFGEYDDAQLRHRTFDEFPEGKDLQVGKWIVATNDKTGAQYGYYVKDKTVDSIALDFNHPLAGKDLFYHVKVVQVRPASIDELEYLRPCQESQEESNGRNEPEANP